MPIVSLYPNPVFDNLTITVDAPLSAITIYDINGRKYDLPFDSNTGTANVSALLAGVYFISLNG